MKQSSPQAAAVDRRLVHHDRARSEREGYLIARGEMKKRLSAKRKSELCLMCGKCCMSMTFYGGEVDDEARDEIQWMELHGLKIDYVEKRMGPKRTITEYYFSIPQRCNALQETGGKFTCGVYETRPQMCRDYDGRMEGPFGVADCFWRLESEGKPLAATNIVQLSRSNG